MNCNNCKNKMCCRVFDVPLTPEEHESGFYKVDTERLKNGVCVLQKTNGGECVYLQNGKCIIYNNRPETCREYLCSTDERLCIDWVESCQKNLRGIYPHQMALLACAEYNIPIQKARNIILGHIKTASHETA